MTWLRKLDDTDPIDRSYRRYFRLFVVCAQLVGVLAIIVLLVGVPHLQCWEYTYMGTKPSNGIVTAEQKVEAWYLSVTGWKYVRSGEYGQQGCPYILFIPVNDCIDWSKANELLPVEFFN